MVEAGARGNLFTKDEDWLVLRSISIVHMVATEGVPQR